VRPGERIDIQLGKFDRDGTNPMNAAGRRIQIEGGIPTETVRIALQSQGNHWRGRIITVLDPAPERTTPICPVVDVCGGCEWQHLDQAGQLRHKAAILRRLLAARRLPTRIDEIVPMSDPGAIAFAPRSRSAHMPDSASFGASGSSGSPPARSCIP
jgi:23S rRNA (uracil1939-C5)-methyltransferase